MAVARLNTNAASHVSTTSLSVSRTINAGGTNVVAFAVFAFDANSANNTYSFTSGPTLGGNAMTACGALFKGGTLNSGVAVYYLINPPTGSQTLAVTMSGPTEIYYNLVVFQGVDQTTPVRASTYTTSTNPSFTVSTAAGDMTLTVINGGSSGVSGTNQTSDGIDSTGNFGMGSDHSTTTSGTSRTHTWSSTSGNGAVAAVGLSIQAAAGGIPNEIFQLNQAVKRASYF